MLSEKGKYASATENRRLVWNQIIWPLILELNDVEFSLGQFQKKRDQICDKRDISVSIPSRGLVSLVQKGIIRREENAYSIHHRLIPYMRLKAVCDYATAIHEVRLK